MPRLRNIRTGALVSCSNETAARLGSEWELADEATKQVANQPVTVAELEAEIDLINASREDDLKIVPVSRKKADLLAALEADKASSSAADPILN
jgi:hypothetical protein